MLIDTHAHIYEEDFDEDLCLDLGGGKNPGNYPICVLER